MKTTLKRIAGLLTAPASRADQDVHFHAGSAGPYVCENPRCVSPALTRGDVT